MTGDCIKCPHCKRMVRVVAKGHYLGAHYVRQGSRTHCDGGGLEASVVREARDKGAQSDGRR